MATKYWDVDISAGKPAVAAAADTSTVTNHVRVAWNTGISRDGLRRALKDLDAALGDSANFPSCFTETRAAADRAIS